MTRTVTYDNNGTGANTRVIYSWPSRYTIYHDYVDRIRILVYFYSFLTLIKLIPLLVAHHLHLGQISTAVQAADADIIANRAAHISFTLTLGMS